MSFAPSSLWYPGSAASSRWPTPATFDSALDALEARLRATEPSGGGARGGRSPTFSLVYGLVDGNSGPGGLDAVDAALAMSQRLPRDRFEVVRHIHDHIHEARDASWLEPPSLCDDITLGQ